MQRNNAHDLQALLAVAREKSFTRAAARLGVSQSALSHTIRGLEERMGVRLLTRTTRSVSPTEAGERLIAAIEPAFRDIDAALDGLSEWRERPAGTFRITAAEHPVDTVLWPALAKVLLRYPDIKVEISVDSSLNDIVAERFDAGVRLGEQVEKDMIAVRIGPDMRMAVVGSPDYLAKRRPPMTPRDLTDHTCINIRLRSYGGLYAWEFAKGGRELRVRVEGQIVFNSTAQVVQAALDGFGLGCVLEDQVLEHIAAGRLVRVLEDWCPPFPGYHLYYPTRRHHSSAFALLVDALRYRPHDTGRAPAQTARTESKT